MAQLLKRVQEELLKAVVSLTLNGILALVGAWAITFLTTEPLVSHVKALHEFYRPIFALIFVIIAVGSFVLLQRYSRHRVFYPKLKPDFDVIEKEINFNYISSSDIVYRRRYKLRCRRLGISEFRDYFHWTGRGNPTIRCKDPTHTIRLDDRLNVMQHFSVMFPRKLNKNEVIDTEIIWHLIDENYQMVPFISAVIEAPTDNLTFRIALDRSLGVTMFYGTHLSGIGSSTVFGSKDISAPNGTAEWVILTPKLKHCYQLEWRLPSEVIS